MNCVLNRLLFQSIFLTLVNEYTDWSRAIEQPINILESMADILSDSLVVSPLIQTGDLHSGLHQLSQSSAQPESASISTSKTFFYIFMHQVHHHYYQTQLYMPRFTLILMILCNSVLPLLSLYSPSTLPLLSLCH